MSVSRQGGLGLLGGLAAALLLAGCGGGTATSLGPVDASPEAASAAPAAAPPPSDGSPQAGAAPTPAADARVAVEQAVRDYVAAANTAMATGDTAALRALSTPDCSCLRLAESIEQLYGSGGRAEGARWDLEELTVVDVTGTSASVRVVLDGSAYMVSGASQSDSFPATEVRQLISLQQQSDWRVSSVDELSRA